MSNPVRVPLEFTQKVEARVSMDRGSLKDMQRDVNTLKVVQELRGVNSSKVVDGHRGKKFEFGAKERKDARTGLKKLAIGEMQKDGEMEAKMERLARDDAKK